MDDRELFDDALFFDVPEEDDAKVVVANAQMTEKERRKMSEEDRAMVNLVAKMAEIEAAQVGNDKTIEVYFYPYKSFSFSRCCDSSLALFYSVFA